MDNNVNNANNDVKWYYANSVGIGVSLYDFSFQFGRVMPINNQDSQEIIPVVESIVTMSPQHAKAFLQILKQNVDEYEKNFGKIGMPNE